MQPKICDIVSLYFDYYIFFENWNQCDWLQSNILPFEYQLTSQDIVLNESYYSEQEAKDCVNSIRKIAIDSIELTELVEKPINYIMCGIPVCVGLVLIIIYMISIIVRKKK